MIGMSSIILFITTRLFKTRKVFEKLKTIKKQYEFGF
jgi:hypothetical protein